MKLTPTELVSELGGALDDIKAYLDRHVQGDESALSLLYAAIERANKTLMELNTDVHALYTAALNK